MAIKKTTKSPAKKGKSGLWWGLIIGLVLGAGAVYYYQEHFNKSEFEKKAEKIEKEARKEAKKAEKGIKDLFDK
jgi:uncharacterized protein HemX